MARSKRLDITYHNGQPDGIRSISDSVSAMTTYVIPRSLLSEAKKISGITHPGIYYLISETDDNKIAQIYVGQTRNGVVRLDDHNRSKDFWTKAILFLADKKAFSLDMISGLEVYAIRKVNEAKRYKVENTVCPKYEIDEFNLLPQVEEIYEKIEFIMATQGYKMNDSSVNSSTSAETLHTTRRGIEAYGLYSGEKFEVLAGSQIDLDCKCYSKTLEKQRQTALEKGAIVRDGKKYKLNVSVSFTSPSSAGEFVLGGSINGWVEWKNRNGATLDQLKRREGIRGSRRKGFLSNTANTGKARERGVNFPRGKA